MFDQSYIGVHYMTSTCMFRKLREVGEMVTVVMLYYITTDIVHSAAPL